MKSAYYRFWPFILIFLTWFIFANPYFLKGLVPYPSKYQVTFFHPWSLYEKWWGPVKNNAMPDIISQIYPWKYFTVDTFKTGKIPYWNPYSFAGNPHLGNFQSAVFSPFNLLFLLLPFIDAWSILILMQPLIAGIFTLIYLRELKISKPGSIIGSITFMFCGFNVVWMAYGTLSMAIVFLPLALYGIEKAFSEKKVIYLSIFSISLIISLFSGHIQTSFYFVIFCFMYLVFKYFVSRNLRLLFYTLLFFIAGVSISLIQVYPTFVLYQNSVRSETLHQGGGIPLNYLVTMIAPDFYGNPVTRNDWFGAYAEWSSFVGIIPLFLALLSIFTLKGKQSLFFVTSGILFLLFSTETIFHTILIASRLPILATSIPSRIIVLFSFNIAILAAYGLDYLIICLNKKTFRKIFTAILALTIILVLIWILLLTRQVLPTDKTNIALKNLLLPTIILVTISIIIGFNKITANKLLIKITFITILVLMSFDSLRFAGKWMPFDSRELVYPELPVIAEMQKNIGQGRVFGNIGTEVTTYYKLSSIEGYDPLYIKRYGEFLRYASTGAWAEAERSVAKLSRRSELTPRALDLLSVSLIYHPIADTNTSWAYPVWEKTNDYTMIYSDDKFRLYKNNKSLQRVKLYYAFDVINKKELILKRLFDPSFDIYNRIILEKNPSLKISNIEDFANPKLLRDQLIDGQATIVKNSPNNILISVNTKSPALLFLSDNYYPNWEAYVNEMEAEIYRANYTFRAVAVPAGESIVEFNFKGYF